MNLIWWMIAPALVGADDPQPGKPDPLSAPRMLGIKVSQPPNQGLPSSEVAEKTPNSGGEPAASPVSQAVTKFIEQGRSALAASTREPAPLTRPDEGRATAAAPAKGVEPLEVWPMTLAQAIRIALDNSAFVRVRVFGAEAVPIGCFLPPEPIDKTALQPIPPAGPADWLSTTRAALTGSRSRSIFIQPLSTSASPARFKADAMALVRSVEQHYWSLAQAQVAHWALEHSVCLGTLVHDREAAELTCRGSLADVAEVAARLVPYRLDLVTRTSDLITTEQQLRQLLGLPTADRRRIIPVTPPTESRIESDCETSLEVDAAYTQYTTAEQRGNVAAQRLDAQRAYYEEGRITADRLLEAVFRYAAAVATEFHYLASYNTSIFALSEAKSTLLADCNIRVVEGSGANGSHTAGRAKVDDKAETASFEPEKKDRTKGDTAQATPKTWTFSITIGCDKPVHISATVSRDD